MLQMNLPDWLSACLYWVRWKACGCIPSKIGGEERIMRTIFHPANFNKKKGTLKSNFMRPPANDADEDDATIQSNKLSTTRYDYAGIEFCRSHARAHQSEPCRHYWGFGRFVVNCLETPRMIENSSFVCKVKCKPADDNPAHANIDLGFRLKIGEPLDGQAQEYIKQLAESAEIYEDPNPTGDQWTGRVIDNPMFGTLKYKAKP